MKNKTFTKGILIGFATFFLIFLAFTFISSRINLRETANIEEKVNQIFTVLDDYYVDEYDKNYAIECMYKGLVYSLGDPYTYYLSAEENQEFKQKMSGEYAGIGVTVKPNLNDNTIEIVAVYPDGPAYMAGIVPGDRITKVDGKEVNAQTIDEAVSLIKGEAGTSVNLTIYRPSSDSTFEVDVVRDVVIVPTIEYEMLDENIGYIEIESFDANTYDQFMIALEDLQSQGMQGLIIDVRNNPGGSLDAVVKITDELIPEGYVTYTEDKNGERVYYESDEYCIDIPIVVLINENSASASEVLSGAVQATGSGVLVGTQSYGKGLVQTLVPLPDGSAVKVTTSKYYTPAEECIQDVGLTPDYVVEMSEEKTNNLETLPHEEDEQLQYAIQVMNDMLGL